MVDFYVGNAPLNTIYEKGLEDNIGFLPSNIVNIVFRDEYNTFQISTTFERFYKLAGDGVVKINYSEPPNIANYLGFVQSAVNNTIIVHIIEYNIQDGSYIAIRELTITADDCEFTNRTKTFIHIRKYDIKRVIENIISNNELQISYFGDFDEFIENCKKGYIKVYSSIHGDIICNVIGNDKIILQWNDETNIHHCVINRDMTYTHNTIQIVDQTLYRLSNLNIEPITNPKIWVGTSAQYAAIAEKDVNTTYIVKSE